jgi:hypothetical protein
VRDLRTRRYSWASPASCTPEEETHQRAGAPLALYTDRAASSFGEALDLVEPEAGGPLPGPFLKYDVKAGEKPSSGSTFRAARVMAPPSGIGGP